MLLKKKKVYVQKNYQSSFAEKHLATQMKFVQTHLEFERTACQIPNMCLWMDILVNILSPDTHIFILCVCGGG